MFHKKNLIVFDIETVIDTRMAKAFLNLSTDIDDETVIHKLEEYHLGITDGKNSFARQPFHKVVAIAFLHASLDKQENGQESFQLMDLRAGGKEDFTEAQLLESFFQHLQSLKPRLVTFNGRTFDLPVLKYRAMHHGIAARWLYKDGDKWNNYHSRYSVDWHCDLLDALSDYGASARVKLNEICALVGVPGKLGIDGSLVGDMYKAGKLREIRDYCELDVISTYLVYLSYMRHTGDLSHKAFELAKEELHLFLDKGHDTKQHYKAFLDSWTLGEGKHVAC